MLGGKRLTADESEALWEEMEKAFNAIERRRREGATPTEPWTAAERRGARPPTLGVVDRRARRVAALQGRAATR